MELDHSWISNAAQESEKRVQHACMQANDKAKDRRTSFPACRWHDPNILCPLRREQKGKLERGEEIRTAQERAVFRRFVTGKAHPD